MVGQRENVRVHAVVQFARVAALKVGASAAANEQRVAGEHEAVFVIDERPTQQLTIENDMFNCSEL